MRDMTALIRFIAEREAMPFAFGRHANDCVSYGLGAVLAQTGRNPLPGVTWSTALGASRVLRRHGGLEAAIDRVLPRVALAKARRGDIAGIERDGELRLMVVEGEMLVGPGAVGNERLARTAMVVAWSIEGLLADG